MKKTKLLILISALLVVATVLCSCGGLKTAKPDKILSGNYENTDKLLTAAAEIDLEKMDIVRTSGKFVELRDYNSPTKWAVYNLEKNAKVYTYTETETTKVVGVEFYETDLYGVGMFTVTIRTTEENTNNKYTTTLYDEAGNPVTSADEANVEVHTSLDLLTFNGKCYRVASDKGYTELSNWNDLAGSQVLESLREATKTYYYAYQSNGSSGGTSVTVYDKRLNYVSSYLFPSYADVTCVGVLKDGKMLIQYSQKLPDTAEKYDYLDADAAKYQLVTEIFDAKSGKTSALKTEYVFLYTSCRDLLDDEENTFAGFSDKVKAMAVVMEIKDGRVSEDYYNAKIVVMSESGKVQSSMTDMFPGMINMLEPIGENLYVYRTLNGATYLANKEGKLLGDISGNRGINNKYILGERKLYNLDMTVAFDFSAQNLHYKTDGSDVVYTNEGVFFEKEDGSVYFYSGELKEVISQLQLVWKTLTVEDEYFIVRHAEGALNVTYTCFAADGKSLLTTDYEVQRVASFEGTFLFRGVENGDYIYYRLAA